MKKILFGMILTAACAANSGAQVAQGGDYTLRQGVVGSGGGTSADAGNVFRIIGTSGQPAAGTNSAGGDFAVSGGFQSAAIAPTSATVFLGGRVTVEGSGKGIRNVTVTLIGANGATRSVLTGAGGRFRFDEVEVGQTYVFQVSARRYTFAQSTLAHTAAGNYDELNFTGTGQF